jgi:hypothetical protein
VSYTPYATIDGQPIVPDAQTGLLSNGPRRPENVSVPMSVGALQCGPLSFASAMPDFDTGGIFELPVDQDETGRMLLNESEVFQVVKRRCGASIDLQLEEFLSDEGGGFNYECSVLETAAYMQSTR